MKYKALLPTQLFIIFEYMPIVMFTSSANTDNHYNFYIPQNYINKLSTLINLELTLNNGFLIDLSSVDFQYTKQAWILKVFKKTSRSLLFFLSYYIYWSKLKITLFSFLKKKINKYSLISIERFYFNSNWLEREVAEMYGIYFYKKNDTRNLLLEYSFLHNPMLKNFPCEGYSEVYFNTLNTGVTTLNIESVEL